MHSLLAIYESLHAEVPGGFYAEYGEPHRAKDRADSRDWWRLEEPFTLNQFTADATGKKVLAGPTEAAVLGNNVVQMLATGSAGSLEEMRAIVERSFPVDAYEPRDADAWNSKPPRYGSKQYAVLTA